MRPELTSTPSLNRRQRGQMRSRQRGDLQPGWKSLATRDEVYFLIDRRSADVNKINFRSRRTFLSGTFASVLYRAQLIYCTLT